MMSASIVWILLLYTLIGVFSVAESKTCWYDHNEHIYCHDSDCCGTYSNPYCCTRTGTIIGSVIGCLAFIIIVASIITCCCCACCPVYQYRTQGTAISTAYSEQSYQTIPDTSPYPSNSGPDTVKPAGEYSAPPPYQV
ncbi:protein shisa-5-like isoform X2 [Mercenaria mercenaria]|uniref:protein shisa-5-like isoform X2 n=1 Tax=Mercenaria mercenaria TaxID=6596 RepID=UPI00234FA1CC|nr:protein shisa-5-like isoform X2 [Mercenaria mercenaria]